MCRLVIGDKVLLHKYIARCFPIDVLMGSNNRKQGNNKYLTPLTISTTTFESQR